MTERRTIGQILLGFGRITEADVERALQHQRANGGYFGEALLALGLVSQEELEWSLASQFDLPYVFPDADSIDPEAAQLVTPEWALANLVLPIMKTSDSVTVLVDSPIKTDPVDELQNRTGLRIELALASAGKIRELIREIYARVGPEEERADAHSPVEVAELFGIALELGAPRFGISVRGRRLMGWYEDRGTVRRRLLTSSWSQDLEGLLSPSPEEAVDGPRASWAGQLSREGMSYPVEVRYLSTSAGTEYLFRLVEEGSHIRERFSPPSAGTLKEIQLLARSGSARFAVTAEPSELAREILPFLPALLLDPAWRSVHVGEGEDPGEEVFAVSVPSAPKEREEKLEELRSFHFDAVTADLSGDPDGWLEPVLDVASAVFVRWDPEVDRRAGEEAGVRWQLHVEAGEGETLEWSLRPLQP